MDMCDRCALPTCANCPYAEPEKSIAEQFMDKVEEDPDEAIIWLGTQVVDCVIRELIEIYWRQNKVFALREINKRIK